MRSLFRPLFRLGLLLFALQMSPAASAQSIVDQLVTPGPLSSAHAKLEKTCKSCHVDYAKGGQNAKCLSCHKGVSGDISARKGFHGKSTARSGQCKSCHSEHRGRNYALVKFTKTSFKHSLTDYPLKGKHATATCASCHKAGVKYRNAPTACVSCHKKNDKHLGRLGTNCQSCHSETGWNPIKPYNHKATGFPLTGKHAAVTCMGCHAGQKWKGLSRTCIGCHKKDDKHLGARGTNCASCHTTATWKSAKFDHNSMTRFDLTGAHRSVSCAGCHGANNRVPKPGMTCISCHKKDDKHKGSRGTKCAECHTTSTWTSASFDHNKMTRFKLTGAHRNAGCAECHGAGNRVPKPAMTCIGCHKKDDKHNGTRGTNCAECHSSTSWKNTSFNHNTDTIFPLTGKHAAVACAGCHGAGNAKPKPETTCYACHQKDDSHAGNNGRECQDCHTANAWSETSFDHDKMTRFALIGAHRAIECNACHKAPAKEVKPPMECVGCHAKDDAHKERLGPDCGTCHDVVKWKEGVRFDHDLTRFPLLGKHAPLACVSCHADQTFAAKGTTCASCHKDEHHAGRLGAAPNCASCHNSTDWKQWSFDHDKATQFPLTGKHRGLICSACHAPGKEPAKTSSECATCHTRDDIHNGSFGTNCARCHTTETFAGASIQ